ncbi:MAG: preprotein translocase subunit SecG [Candidatus Moranbacteria bacterium]|nr:preprotein translocase subunit SecG [Candidatus Moranbacteria bacterium]
MNTLTIAQTVIATLLIISILLQNRGTGLGTTFGSDMGSYYTKRGFEQFLLYASIVLSIFFIVIGIANVVSLNG